jgi:hypothetical protein
MSEMNRKTECAAVLRGHGTTSGRSAANVQFDTEKPRTKCPLVAHCLPSCTDHRPTRIEIEKSYGVLVSVKFLHLEINLAANFTALVWARA